MAQGSIVYITLHGRAVSMCVSAIHTGFGGNGSCRLAIITGETTVSVLQNGEEPPGFESCQGTETSTSDLEYKGAPEWSGSDLEAAVETVCLHVGGCDGAVRAVVQAVSWSLLCAPAFLEYGLAPPVGVLLFGPPGTGKTLLAGCGKLEVRVFLHSVDH